MQPDKVRKIILDNLKQGLHVRFVPSLDIDEIKRDAGGRMEVARRMEELQLLASRVFPGSRVVLITADHAPRLMSSFSSLPGMEQIMVAMCEVGGGGPVELQHLHSTLLALGSSMSVETLMSQLSRGKDELFVNPSRGFWGLVPSAMNKHRSMRGYKTLP